MPSWVWYDMQFGFVCDEEADVSECEVEEIAGSDRPHREQDKDEEMGIHYEIEE